VSEGLRSLLTATREVMRDLPEETVHECAKARKARYADPVKRFVGDTCGAHVLGTVRMEPGKAERFDLANIDVGNTQPDTTTRATHFDLLESVTDTASDAYLHGYGSMFDVGYVMYDMWGAYVEHMSPQAFDRSLAEPDLQTSLLIGHSGLGLATTRAGRMALSADGEGLAFVASLNLEEPDARGLFQKLGSGSTPSDTSVGGWIREAEWNDWLDVVEIMDWDLMRGEISVVQAGANPAGWAAVLGSMVSAPQRSVVQQNLAPFLKAALSSERYAYEL